MYKAIYRLKEQKGFTLIELLIVIAILGILSAIAIPTYLGQREKARVRSVESGAKGSVSEIQGYLDSMVAGDPFLILTSADPPVEICIESSNASASGKTCNAIYNMTANSTTYNTANTQYANQLIPLVINHHVGKRDRSPFTGNNLFVTTAAQGTVVLTAGGDRTIRIQGFGVLYDNNNAIFNTTVMAR